ncbi:DUF4232 domain-containing protein [Streptomyces angustmyceticus]|uniref:DUF4232 domain-containing protein n=1 Tax=Streptomyces angustmyceticus TaxID=285578 RepID=A0A5J4LIB2_9ACTN|nr:DUF4232 domain-containing protein [Streptomyces angustmyceticus]UAL68206.1 DUF4232 domain-containing protein [Streptomyces angustmyceticus]GES31651.1 hypothetical protein San01_41380 [Streptomyces angustmyceticus]
MPRSHTRSEAVVETAAGAPRGSRGVRRRAPRLAAAGLTAVAALALTACGGQDNPLQTSAAKPFHPTPQVSRTPVAQPEEAAQGGTRTGGGRTEQASAGHGGNRVGTVASTRTDGAGARATGANTRATSGGAPGVRHTACDAAKIRLVARPLTRPVDHLLLQATNTSGTTCDLYSVPHVRFGGAPSLLPDLPDSKPRSTVTLAPGASGYAGVLTSSADGSGRNGRTMTSLSVGLPGRDGKGSIGGPAAVALPGGSVYADDSAWVTYWQPDANEAAAW